jgi:2-octaprenyl-6-methoxyphenol hydroxylase
VRLSSGETLDAALIVAADGGHVSLPGMRVFTRDHGQSAVVAQVRASSPKSALAFERFTTQGPIALLPLDDAGRYGLVWTHPRERAQEVCSLPTAQFEQDANAAFGDDVGALTLLNVARHYPLALKYTEPRAVPRLMAIGNAAQSMHPIAGQGLNLGLRDAWDLAQCTASVPTAQLGGLSLTVKFGLKRARDRFAGVLMTESLVSAFGLENRLAHAARGVGIAAFDALAPLKRAVAKRMIFGS